MSEPTPCPEEHLVEGWRPRPVLAVAVGVAWCVVPVGVSIGVALAVATSLGRPASLGAWLGWLALLGGVSSLVLWASQRVARRLLGLRALLRLGLAFPGATPSRFAVALRGGSTRQLDRLVGEGSGGGTGAERDAAVHLLGLVAALNVHDRATRGHSERVRAYTELIAEELGLDRPAREALRWGGLVHDIGKLRVPAEILNKTGSLTSQEWEVIRRHPGEGAKLAEAMSPWLGEWTTAVLDHHERWEGGGYPRALSGTEISLAGRIVAVADAFDVMTSVRSYKPPLRPEQAREELVRCAGTQFDPMVVRAFLNISVRRISWIIGALSAIAPWPAVRWRLARSARWLPTPVAVAAITGVAAIVTPGAVAEPARTAPPTVLTTPVVDPERTTLQPVAQAFDQMIAAHPEPETEVELTTPPNSGGRQDREARQPVGEATNDGDTHEPDRADPNPGGDDPPPSGPHPTDPAKSGLCNAYAQNADRAKQEGRAFKDLAATSAAADQTVQDYCADATPPGQPDRRSRSASPRPRGGGASYGTT